MFLEDIEKVLYSYSVIVLRGAHRKKGRLILEGGNDVDLFLGKKYLEFSEALGKLGFIITHIGLHRYHAYFYEKDLGFLFLDVIDDVNVDINDIFDVSFTKTYIKKVLSDPINNKDVFSCFRYLLNFKKTKLPFLLSLKDPIKNIDNYLEGKIFRRKILKKDLEAFLSRDFLTFTKYLYGSDVFKYYLKRLLQKISKVFSGKSYIFLGPDGVGKSTILNRLQADFGFKIYYLGSLNTYYRDLNINGNNRKTYQRIGKFIQLYLVYINTLYHINKDIFFGHTVLIDRFDRYTLGLTLKQNNVFKYTRRFFFKPFKSCFVGLVGDPIIIHKRKMELSAKETNMQNEEVETILSKEKGILIDNFDLILTLNKILFYIYSKV